MIMVDDATHNDFSLYEATNVQTLNIFRHAFEGMTFNQAYLSMLMCAPSRFLLYKGMYAVRIGVSWIHSPAREGR